MRGDARLATSAATAVGYLTAYRFAELLCGPSHLLAIAMFRRWAAATCRRLRVELRVDGERPPGNCLFVSNHRSYLDVLVLAQALDATFLSRADVAGWRMIGPTARAMGAVFVERDEVRGRVRAARALARRLCSASVVVFPEGTTNGASLPGPFEAGPFRLLQRLRAQVVPVTVRYSRRTAYWVDDVDVGTHLRRDVLPGPPIAAAVHVGAPLEPCADGAALCRLAYRAVAAPIETLGELVTASVPS